MNEAVQKKLLDISAENLKEVKSLEILKTPKIKLEKSGNNKYVSDKLEVKFNDTVGRHVVAVDDIEVGEVLVDEVPLASVLHQSKLSSNCSNCLTSVISGVGCDQCSQVIFCSKKCKTEACSTFHRYECGNLHLVPPAGPLTPALRIFTRYSLEYFLQSKHLLSSHNPESGWDYSQFNEDDSTILAAYNMQVCQKNVDYQLRFIEFIELIST